MLARAGELLSSSLDYERTLQQVAELAVPELADWCAVSLPDGRGFIRAVAVAHADPEKVAFARRIGERYPTRVDAPGGRGAGPARRPVAARQRHHRRRCSRPPRRTTSTSSCCDGVGMRAALTVPMTAGGTIVGALTLISAESGPALQRRRRRARRGARPPRRHRGRERPPLHASARTSRARCRRACCPAQPAARCPAGRPRRSTGPAGDENWVGGDFYDAFAVRGGWLAIVGDVAGRGRRGGRAHRPRPPHAAHGGDAARRPARRACDTLNGELAGARRDVALLGRGRAAARRRGRRGHRGRHLRRPSAAAARARRRRRRPSARSRRCSAPTRSTTGRARP